MERIVEWRAAVLVQAKNHTGQVRVVRLGTAELIIGSRRSARPVRQILQLAAPPVVAHEDVQLAIGPEPKDAAVVIAPRRLALIALPWRHGCTVVLKCTQHDQVVFVDER